MNYFTRRKAVHYNSDLFVKGIRRLSSIHIHRDWFLPVKCFSLHYEGALLNHIRDIYVKSLAILPK